MGTICKEEFGHDADDIAMICYESYREYRSFSLPCVYNSPLTILASKPLCKKDVRLGRLLGSGGFGSVYLAVYKNKDVAVKVMHSQSKNPAAQLQSVRAELAVLQFKHANIVRSISATPIEEYNDGTWIVMEYIRGTTLQAVIHDPQQEIGMVRRMKYATQLASAIEYSHDNCIAHLDIKPANVLITVNDDCKLGDFGCCQEVLLNTGRVSPTNRSALTGTFAYRAPELLKGGVPSVQADIYSFGIMLWQLLSRETPYANEDQHVIIFRVVAYGLRPKIPDVEYNPLEQLYKDLYVQCWFGHPDERPTAAELVEILATWNGNLN